MRPDWFGCCAARGNFEDIIRITCTVKPVYNDHPWDPKFEAVVDRWSLSRGLCYKDLNWDSKIVVAVGRWSLAQV